MEQMRFLAFDSHFWGALLMLVLLVLEVGDRVVMKRDLQIAKEIQTWLLPASPPDVPGLEIAFATRPANTVAGDYYDVFPRAGSTPGESEVGLRHGGCSGQEHSGRAVDGHHPGQPENPGRKPFQPA